MDGFRTVPFVPHHTKIHHVTIQQNSTLHMFLYTDFTFPSKVKNFWDEQKKSHHCYSLYVLKILSSDRLWKISLSFFWDSEDKWSNLDSCLFKVNDCMHGNIWLQMHGIDDNECWESTYVFILFWWSVHSECKNSCLKTSRCLQ